MTDPQVALLMLGVFIFIILLGFPIAFTLMAMGIFFGYYAYFDADRMWRSYEHAVSAGADPFTLTQTWLAGFFNNRIFDLFVNQTYSVMANDVLTAVPLFLFMGYIVERANIVDRLFSTLFIAARRLPGAMAVAALVTCALFATATGIVGAVVTLMGLLAFPAMLKARYDVSFASGVVCAGGTLGILIPPSIMLIVYAAASGVSIVQLYAGALLPGFLLAGLYLVYIIGRAWLQPSIAPKPRDDEIENVTTGKLIFMLLTSFLPLAILILAVLGSILFGLATPSEAAAVGALGRAGARRRLSLADLAAAAGIGLSDGPDDGDGVLALRRLVDLLLGLRLSRRRAGHHRVRHRPQHPSGHFPDPGAGHHLPARLAARMVGDHHHLRADLPAAFAAFRHRPAVLRHPGRAQPADLVPDAADGHVGLLSEGHRAAARAARADIPRLLPVPGDGVPGDDPGLSCSRQISSYLPKLIYGR